MDPKVRISTVANVWCKQMYFEHAKDSMPGHKHTFDHHTLLAYGEFTVKIDNEVEFKGIQAPNILVIKAGKAHEIIAETDGAVAYCIHPIRDGEKVEDIADPAMLPPYAAKFTIPVIE